MTLTFQFTINLVTMNSLNFRQCRTKLIQTNSLGAIKKQRLLNMLLVLKALSSIFNKNYLVSQLMFYSISHTVNEENSFLKNSPFIKF